METGWLAILTAVFAGGLLNQLFTAFWGDQIAFKREFKRWKRSEKYKAFSELMDLISTSRPEYGYDKWPGKIRAASQKVYLLHKGGRPPQQLCDYLEDTFQLANKFRDGEVDREALRNELRIMGSLLRRELAISLEKDE